MEKIAERISPEEKERLIEEVEAMKEQLRVLEMLHQSQREDTLGTQAKLEANVRAMIYTENKIENMKAKLEGIKIK